MINAIDLGLLKDRKHFRVQGARRLSVAAKRLLDDYTRPRAIALRLGQPRRAQLLDEQISKAMDSLGTQAGKNLFVAGQEDLKKFYQAWTKEIETGMKAI